MKNRGFSLVEIIIYTAILVGVVFFVVQSIIGLYKSHSLVILNRDIEYSAESSMDKILNEIREASSVNKAGSVFNTSPGTLSLSGVKSGTSYTIVFTAQNNAAVFSKDGGANIPLTASDVSLDSLIFKFASTTNSSAVKVDLTVSGSKGGYSKSISLSGFAILRGSY